MELEEQEQIERYRAIQQAKIENNEIYYAMEDEILSQFKSEPEIDLELEDNHPPESDNEVEIEIPNIKEELSYELELQLLEGDQFKSKTIDGVVEILTRQHHFAQSKWGELYIYKDGVYITGAAKSIKHAANAIRRYFNLRDKDEPEEFDIEVEEEETSKKTKKKKKPLIDFNSRTLNEIVEAIKLGPQFLLEKPNLEILNLKNGLLYVFDGEIISLEPHDPTYRTTVQLNTHYDPSAQCPTWDKLIKDVFPEGSENLAWLIIAWLMFPITSIKKSVLLYGLGNDGKSIFLKGIKDFLGKENWSGISLHNLDDKFQGYGLVNKLANIDTDLSAKDLVDSSNIKRITGGDTLRIEQKYGMPFDYEPFARCIFSCNTFPTSNDKSQALKNRFIIVPFLNSFKENAQLKYEIESKLSDPLELAGVLNKALKALPILLREEFDSCKQFVVKSREILESNDSLPQWLNDYTIEDKDQKIPVEELHEAYCKAEPLDRARKSRVVFGKAIKEFRPNIERKQVREGFKKPWFYVGIGLLTEQIHLEEGEEDTSTWQ